VDRTGFPLETGCFEGNKAENLTIVPIVKAFQQRHGSPILSSSLMPACSPDSTNLCDLDQAGLRFIVGSRVNTFGALSAGHHPYQAREGRQLSMPVVPISDGFTKAPSKVRITRTAASISFIFGGSSTGNALKSGRNNSSALGK
jgi:hypothetical protein